MKSIFNLQFSVFNKKQGNAWVGILLLLVFLLTLGLALVSDSILTITQTKRAARVLSAQSLSDAGVEKAIWMLNDTSGNWTGETGLDLGAGIIDIYVNDIDSENKEVIVDAFVPEKDDPTNPDRTIRAKITAISNESAFSFHYGIQVGETGIEMSNNSKVMGSVYSGGSIEGGNGAAIEGDLFISGDGNHLNNVDVGCDSGGVSTDCPIAGSAHVHTINDSHVYGDAFYDVISNTTVDGNTAPFDSPAPISLPLSDATIDQWKSWAQAEGEYPDPNYTLSGNGVTDSLGPIKITGDMLVTNNSTLTLTGVIWVQGNLTISQNATINLDPIYGPSSGMVIVDGTITTENNVVMSGSGDPGSYIMMLSTSSSDPAIDVANNSDSVVYYANNGIIDVANNASIRSITGEGIRLKNGAIVEYETGLANSNFSAGPGGSWEITEWQVLH